jgi:hypothetical protein
LGKSEGRGSFHRGSCAFLSKCGCGNVLRVHRRVLVFELLSQPEQPRGYPVRVIAGM